MKETGRTPYVLRCTNENTLAKYIKISNRNPNNDKRWGLILVEVKVFGAPAEPEAVVDDFLQDVEDILKTIF